MSEATVDALRAFNRFYTRRVGLLEEAHLGSAFSLAQVRVLYEIGHEGASTTTALARELRLDTGYVSRLVTGLRARRLVARTRSATDARQSPLALTASGRKALAGLEATTRDRLAGLLEPLPADARRRLEAALDTVRTVLEPSASTGRGWLLRDPRPGDVGWVVHRQAALYAQEFGWDWTFEGLLAKLCATFVERFDPACERCWIAERDGSVIGSVFLMRRSARVAQLRMLYVEPSARGLGVGRRLVDECIAFARRSGYRKLTLWTNDILVAARRIYEAAGFVLVREEPHRSYGQALVGQYWDLDLVRAARPVRS